MTETRAGPPPAAPPAPSRWKTWALVLSLAFNVLIVGAMVGRAYQLRHGAALVAPVGGPPNLVSFVGSLPMERRRAVWTATAEERRALRPLREAIREARVGLRDALAAEPYDAKRVTEAHARLLAAEVAVRTASQQLISRIAAALGPEERRRFAAHITAEGAKGPRRGPPGWQRELEEREERGAPPERKP